MRVFIGLHAAIAAAAEAMILPELEPQPKLAELADGILQARAAFPDSSYVVILSENLWPGGVHELSKKFKQSHRCDLSPMSTWAHSTWWSAQCARTVILAMQLGAAAVDAILSGKTAMMIGLEQEHVVSYTRCI